MEPFHEGQKVWVLNRDKHFQYVIVGFDHNHELRYVTVLAAKGSQSVRYEDIGNLATAARSGGPGACCRRSTRIKNSVLVFSLT